MPELMSEIEHWLRLPETERDAAREAVWLWNYKRPSQRVMEPTRHEPEDRR